MAVQNLTLYDLIVDLTPGITAIFIFVPLFPSKSLVSQILFGSPFRFGLSLLVLGYVAGRLLHAISGSKIFEVVQRLTDRLYLRAYTTVLSVILWMLADRSWATDPLEDRSSLRRRARSIEERVRGNAETKSQQICAEACDNYIVADYNKGIASFKHFGESLLYGERGLYRKYEMLSTFFRNLSLLFVLSSSIYTFYLHGIPYEHQIDGFVHKSIWTVNTTSPYPYEYAPYFFLTLGFLCYTQRLKFEHRRNRAFIDDLYLKLIEDGPDELVGNGKQSSD